MLEMHRLSVGGGTLGARLLKVTYNRGWSSIVKRPGYGTYRLADALEANRFVASPVHLYHWMEFFSDGVAIIVEDTFVETRHSGWRG